MIQVCMVQQYGFFFNKFDNNLAKIISKIVLIVFCYDSSMYGRNVCRTMSFILKFSFDFNIKYSIKIFK